MRARPLAANRYKPPVPFGEHEPFEHMYRLCTRRVVWVTGIGSVVGQAQLAFRCSLQPSTRGKGDLDVSRTVCPLALVRNVSSMNWGGGAGFASAVFAQERRLSCHATGAGCHGLVISSLSQVSGMAFAAAAPRMSLQVYTVHEVEPVPEPKSRRRRGVCQTRAAIRSSQWTRVTCVSLTVH